MRFLSVLVLVGGGAFLLLAPLAAFLLTSGAAEVQMISPFDSEIVQTNKDLWFEGDPVVDIYGVPTGRPVKIIFADESRIIRPEQDPSLIFYSVDKQKGENPLQVQTVWFFLKWTMIGAGAAFLAGLGGILLFRKPSSAAPAASESSPADA